jgi:hypothetical protein
VGLVTISLPEKLYFYHSTAECFFSGALALLLGYFVWIYNGGPNRFTNTGLGFVFGVGSIVLFFVSSLLMALDDIMRSCRTSILYTDEMATIYTCSQPAAAPAVSAAAKAFASAGASGAASGTAASTNQNNNQNNNNNIQNNYGKNNSNSLENKYSRNPLASKGSEMVAGASIPQTRNFKSVDDGLIQDQSIHQTNIYPTAQSTNRLVAQTTTSQATMAPTSWEPMATMEPSSWDSMGTVKPQSWEPIGAMEPSSWEPMEAREPSSWEPMATTEPSSWEPITGYEDQTNFYSHVNDPTIFDESMPYNDYEERHRFTTAQS